MQNTSLKDNINDFIEERINESYSILNKDKEYKEIENNYIKTFEHLKKNFCKDIELLEELENYEIDKNTMQLQQVYKTAFRDCIQILSNKTM